jgi:hypothetical protein
LSTALEIDGLFISPLSGPFNSWDRQPFLTTVANGTASMDMAWREIHHNFFMDNYSPQENVDNDDGSRYYKTHNNFFVCVTPWHIVSLVVTTASLCASRHAVCLVLTTPSSWSSPTSHQFRSSRAGESSFVLSSDLMTLATDGMWECASKWPRYGGNGMKNDFGGHDNHHTDNIYAYVGRALGVCGALDNHEDVFTGNQVVLTGTSVGGRSPFHLMQPMCSPTCSLVGRFARLPATGGTACETAVACCARSCAERKLGDEGAS